MHPWLVAAGIALVALLIAISDREQPSADVEGVTEPQQALEQAVARLTQRLEELERSVQTAVEEQEGGSTAAAQETGVEWRLAPGLTGTPLKTVETRFDRRRGTVDLLLRIEAPLPDADAWPRESGRSVPLTLTCEDATGSLIAELPLILVRGLSREPGAYVHVRAQLPAEVSDRVRLIRIARD